MTKSTQYCVCVGPLSSRVVELEVKFDDDLSGVDLVQHQTFDDRSFPFLRLLADVFDPHLRPTEEVCWSAQDRN